MDPGRAIRLERARRRIEASDIAMSGSAFINVSLAGAAFNDVNLAGATVDNANLSELRIRNANLSGASIAKSNLEAVTNDCIPVPDFLAAFRASRLKKN